MAKNGSTGCGLISNGGDPHGYLGHFRSPKVMKAGHNFGAPALKQPKLSTPSLGGAGSKTVTGGNMGGSSAPAAPGFKPSTPLAGPKLQNPTMGGASNKTVAPGTMGSKSTNFAGTKPTLPKMPKGPKMSGAKMPSGGRARSKSKQPKFGGGDNSGPFKPSSPFKPVAPKSGGITRSGKTSGKMSKSDVYKTPKSKQKY